MIDLHTHILPGIDDGAPDMETALAMARRACAGGVRKIVATPHVDHNYDTHAHVIESAVATLNHRLGSEGVPLEVLTGAEIASDRLADLDEDELDRLGLGGGPYLLIEAPLSQAAGDFEMFTDERRGDRRRFVLAHPERSPALQRDPERLRRLVLDGTLVSITAASLSGRFGGGVRRFAIHLLEQGMVHNVASDMHDVKGRSPGIHEHLAGLTAELPGIIDAQRWLTEEVPEAVIAGDPVRLPRPLRSTRRRKLRLGWLADRARH